MKLLNTCLQTMSVPTGSQVYLFQTLIKLRIYDTILVAHSKYNNLLKVKEKIVEGGRPQRID